jgi:uncharacterized protein (TIGR03435 family)
MLVTVTRVGLLVVLIAASGLPLASQATRFEDASVKQNVSGDVGGRMQIPPAGAITYINVPLRMLIRDAYQVDPYAESYRLDPGRFAGIVGSPRAPQPNVPRFDVVGKPPDNTLPSERRAMMRALLEDRFKLRVHREMRQMSVYALTVARPGRLGPNLAPSKIDCEEYLAQRRAGSAAPEPVDATGTGWCVSLFAPANLILAGISRWRFAGPIGVLSQRLQPNVDRPIVDATGLSGNFEWVLTFTVAGSNASADVAGLFTAVQEQLGLRLEPREAPVDVLVIDSVEMPTPN